MVDDDTIDDYLIYPAEEVQPLPDSWISYVFAKEINKKLVELGMNLGKVV